MKYKFFQWKSEDLLLSEHALLRLKEYQLFLDMRRMKRVQLDEEKLFLFHRVLYFSVNHTRATS